MQVGTADIGVVAADDGEVVACGHRAVAVGGVLAIQIVFTGGHIGGKADAIRAEVDTGTTAQVFFIQGAAGVVLSGNDADIIACFQDGLVIGRDVTAFYRQIITGIE